MVIAVDRRVSITLTWLAGLALFSGAGAKAADIKAAGCFVPTPTGVVLGIGAFRGDLRIPMGKHKSGEPAHATAARETREEPGLEVRVGPLLKTFENGRVYLFLCAPVAPIDDYSRLQAADDEIAEVIVLDPNSMMTQDGRKITNPWRFAHDRALLIELYGKYRDQAVNLRDNENPDDHRSDQ